MSQETAIGWTDLSWNAVHGCSKVSPGCARCYAETLSLRYGQTRKPWTPENAAENVILKPHKLKEPFSNAKVWRGLGAAAAAAGKTEGKLVFVNSMSDLFHELVPDTFIDQVFAVMAWATRDTFQILTKRPDRMRGYLTAPDLERRIENAMCAACGSKTAPGICGTPGDDCGLDGAEWPLPNCWLGTSIENRRFVGRADLLRETPAAVRFVSAEPLLGPLVPSLTSDADYGKDDDRGLDLAGIDWLIVGGESGKGYRPMRSEWVRDLRDAACASGTAFFVKQDSGPKPGKQGDLPDDLWAFKEFPAVAGVARA